jgi:hypothetical protein
MPAALAMLVINLLLRLAIRKKKDRDLKFKYAQFDHP